MIDYLVAILIALACTGPAVYLLAGSTPAGWTWRKVGAAHYLVAPDTTVWGRIVQVDETSTYRTQGKTYRSAASARRALCRRVRGWQ